jgi:hypothetical protein
VTEVVKHKSQRSESTNTPEVRGAYPWLFKKRTKTAAGRDLKLPRNDVTLLFPKLNIDPTQCANYAYLAKHCMDAAAKAWPGIGWPQGGHWPIQDGDAPMKPKAPVPGQAATPVDPNKYPWRRGNWIIEVTNYLETGVRVCVMQNGQPVEIPAETVNGVRMFKSGDYCIVNLCAYTFQNEKFGCNFGFEGVLWTKPGEAIGSSGPKSAAQMFGATPAPAGAPLPTGPAPQPQTNAAPAYAPPPPAPAPRAPAPPAPGAPPPASPALPPFPQP